MAYETATMYALALEVVTQRHCRSIGFRNAVVALQRESSHQYLTLVRWVGEALGIAGHGGIEHHFAGRPGSVIAKRMAAKNGAVFENQSCGRCLSHNAYRRNIGAIVETRIVAGFADAEPDAVYICKCSTFFRNDSHSAWPIYPFRNKKNSSELFVAHKHTYSPKNTYLCSLFTCGPNTLP